MRFKYSWVLSLVLCLVIPSCDQVPSQTKTSSTISSDEELALKLLWISLDGLNATALAPYLQRIHNPHPRGLKWILKHQHASSSVQVSFPSITAPSHISTLTCAGPGTHGVFLNGGNWNGERDLNGFAMPYATQTWVQALRQQYVPVAVAAYPSVDGASPERSADMGIAYDAPRGKVQYIKLAVDKPASVEVQSHQVNGKSYHFTLNRDAQNHIELTGDIGDAKDFLVGKSRDIYFKDGQGDLARTAGVTLLNLGEQGASKDIVIAVSPVSVMPVTNPALKARLDQKQIVWSNIRDYGFAKYDGGVEFTLETIRHRRAATLAAVKEMIAFRSSEALFLYFEDIDVILHAWSGVSELNDQLGDFLAEFDQVLGEFLSRLPASTNLVVMGDHGMSSIQYELNVRQLLPLGVANKVQLRTSGGTVMLYPKGALDAAPPAELDLAATAQTLRNVSVEFDGGRRVFNKVVVRGSPEAIALGVSGPKSPWIIAFADDGIGLQDRVDPALLVSRRPAFVIPEALRHKYPDPMNSGVLVQPSPLGAHGHDSELASMRTHLMMTGPQLDEVNLGQVTKTTEVVPAVADALNWVRPAACR